MWINQYLNPAVSATEQARIFTAVGFPCESGTDIDADDHQLEVETTSNRGDCLCHIGLAREVAAASHGRLVLPATASPTGTTPASGEATVVNHDIARCPRYTARIVKGVTVGPSPEWMQTRLRAIGQIPRNNVVDCTNFVLFEYGQPTHAFDLATIHRRQIHIRGANAGEPFLPIGDTAKEIALVGGELVVADADRVIALAGVKGGAATSVTDATTDLLIEAASFDPVAVRSSSRRHQIASDSSYRFERGVAPGDIDDAADRLVALILETAGGRACAGSIVAGPALAPRPVITLRLSRLSAVIGFTIPATEVTRILEVLGFDPLGGGDSVRCTVPARRLDVTREIDLIEEVIRHAGLDRVPTVETVAIRPVGPQCAIDAVRVGRDTLAAAGFVESVTHTLVSERAAAPFVAPARSWLRTDDERSLGEPVLRPSLVPSLLGVLKLNADRGGSAPRLFEHAATFWLEESIHRERRSIAMIASEGSDPEASYRIVRAAAERLVRVLRGGNARVDVAASSPRPASATDPCANARHALDPWGTVEVDGSPVGTVGLVRRTVLSLLGLDGPVAACEFDWELLAAGYPPPPDSQPLPTSPLLGRDLSIVVDETVAWAAIEGAILGASLSHLERVRFVGVWRGKPVPSGRKSVTVGLDFRAKGRTLRREEVDPEIARLTPLLSTQLGGELRA